MSEKLQELLLRFLNGERQFSGDCETLKKLILLIKALGREVRIEKKENNLCYIIVEYYRAS
ncbi:hypothetical protein D1868_01185 [Stygiolobus azoricus]|uniref:Uncharacterized protein n=1 Tax=Stygiolobus azoricus TaxID=41675 RepID=A0A650CLI8_9CREN|nr:hypothetical protein D1868_01185 [Stygiolobus azoricus]